MNNRKQQALIGGIGSLIGSILTLIAQMLGAA